MSEALLSPAQVGDQHVELLPTRTVLSLFSCATGGNGGTADPGGDAHTMNASDPYTWMSTSEAGDPANGGNANGGSGRP
ncbi:MAG TPA: hypothetical protein VHY21_09345 [Pseudonocardiaceae bacterium]|jgi:hypothetical protein|nr:hypothetical protein [Pseudonocardiaceae bacterium]